MIKVKCVRFEQTVLFWGQIKFTLTANLFFTNKFIRAYMQAPSFYFINEIQILLQYRIIG